MREDETADQTLWSIIYSLKDKTNVLGLTVYWTKVFIEPMIFSLDKTHVLLLCMLEWFENLRAATNFFGLQTSAEKTLRIRFRNVWSWTRRSASQCGVCLQIATTRSTTPSSGGDVGMFFRFHEIQHRRVGAGCSVLTS